MNMSGNELPQYATELAAGMDVRAANDEPIVLKPLQRALVPTGLFVEIPTGQGILGILRANGSVELNTVPSPLIHAGDRIIYSSMAD